MAKRTSSRLPLTGDNLHLRFSAKRNKATGTLTIHGFVDHGHHVAYIPSLNLSSYGDTHDEAIERMKVVLDDFFSSLAKSPERALLELKKLGWEQGDKLHKKSFVSKAFVDRDGVLRNFNLPKETPIKTSVVKV